MTVRIGGQSLRVTDSAMNRQQRRRERLYLLGLLEQAQAKELSMRGRLRWREKWALFSGDVGKSKADVFVQIRLYNLIAEYWGHSRILEVNSTLLRKKGTADWTDKVTLTMSPDGASVYLSYQDSQYLHDATLFEHSLELLFAGRRYSSPKLVRICEKYHEENSGQISPYNATLGYLCAHKNAVIGVDIEYIEALKAFAIDCLRGLCGIEAQGLLRVLGIKAIGATCVKDLVAEVEACRHAGKREGEEEICSPSDLAILVPV